MDALSFGRQALAAADRASAELFGRSALEHATTADERHAALSFCSEVARQGGQIAEAIALLLRALPHASDPARRAAVQFRLAKLYEHEQGDLVRALVHARGTEPVEGPEQHGRRLGRLYRRLLRQQEQGCAGGV
jgi:hypothetical protein